MNQWTIEPLNTGSSEMQIVCAPLQEQKSKIVRAPLQGQ